MPVAQCGVVLALRLRRVSYAQISTLFGFLKSTIRWILRNINRLARIQPTEPVVCYEQARSGELHHCGIKKLACSEMIGRTISP